MTQPAMNGGIPSMGAVANLTINVPPNGRPITISLPADITDFETLALVAAVINITDQLRSQRQQPLVIAKTMPPTPVT